MYKISTITDSRLFPEQPREASHNSHLSDIYRLLRHATRIFTKALYCVTSSYRTVTLVTTCWIGNRVSDGGVWLGGQGQHGSIKLYPMTGTVFF